MSSFNEAYQKLLSLSNLQTKQYTDSKEELKKSLIRTKRLLASLGNPEKELQFVHVGGTSGKGSVANYIQTALQKSGHSAGVYTSPHTTSYIERFRMGNRLINPARLARHINDITGAYEKLLEAGESPLSFFELSTVIAIYAAKQESMEWCVLEVGCGGRYDATNVIPGKKFAVITNIDKDHTQILGDSLEKIAHAKAGIIQQGTTVICGETRPKLKNPLKKLSRTI
jgi:dihydrofolate synthase/folylpolyglutamate synthase